MEQLHVFHPCQHLVGSGCWNSVPDEIKDKCPVCKVEIQCDEKVRVHSEIVNGGPASLNSNGRGSALQLSFAEAFALAKVSTDRQAQNLILGNKTEDGLKDVDIRAIMYYMNLRARLHQVKGCLSTLLAQTKTLTPAHRERLIIFLANTPQSIGDSKHQKTEVALSAFNISSGTNFTMNDLRKALSSAEPWIKAHFSAILVENAEANKDAFKVRRLEQKLAKTEADLKELKDRLSQESAQRLKNEIELATKEIGRRADEQVLKIRALANAEASRILSKADVEAAKTHAKAIEEVEKLQSHGVVMKK